MRSHWTRVICTARLVNKAPTPTNGPFTGRELRTSGHSSTVTVQHALSCARDVGVQPRAARAQLTRPAEVLAAPNPHLTT